MIDKVPYSPVLAAELARRERLDRQSSPQRVARARAVVVSRMVDVLHHFQMEDGPIWVKIPERRDVWE